MTAAGLGCPDEMPTEKRMKVAFIRVLKEESDDFSMLRGVALPWPGASLVLLGEGLCCWRVQALHAR